uniref:DNA-directed RNA polymerase n=1 Tax=Chlorotetraedron incus TaxID=162317 RepID=A0A140HAA6_9CHLO|nr:RNA polymerase beta subunit [Chlorotetraedron incus]AMO01105.1 RNA polymerase beta subunit [Chlorotetraedron incus]
MPIHRYFLPDFVEIQRQSFMNFLEKGILEEFSKRNPITNVQKDIEIFFYPEYYRLTKPYYTVQQAVFYQKSYVSKLYVPVQYTDKKRKCIFLKWMLIAQLPLMTKRGHFVLNGAARVIVNQLVRSPGVYFRESFYEIYFNKWNPKPNAVAKRFYADIICLKGTWLRIEIDKDYCMWVRLKKGPKIPLLWFLLGMGLNEKMIFQSVISPNFLLNSFNKELEKISSKKTKYLYVSTPPEAWKELAKLLNLKKARRVKKSNTNLQKSNQKNRFSISNSVNIPSFSTYFEAKHFETSFFREAKKLKNQKEAKKVEKEQKKTKDMYELGRKWFFKKFMNPRTYDLGKRGRLAMNQKLGLTISPQQTTLTAQDLLYATDYLMKVEKGLYEIDDIDHLKNRRVRSSGELIQVQFGIGLMRLEKAIRFKLNTKKSGFVFQSSNFQSQIEKEKCEASKNNGDKVFTLEKQMLENSDSIDNLDRLNSKSTQLEIAMNNFLTAPKISKQAFEMQTQVQRIQFNQKQKKDLNTDFLSLNSLIQPKFVNGALKEFFGTHPLSQFMDQINPLSEITHKRRLSSLGPGGVSRDTATLAVRGIHASHYGRICPIETPEGKNTGLVNSLTAYARVNNQGFIETPFYSIYKGQVQKNLGRIYLSADQEESLKIATPDLNLSDLNFLPKQNIPVRFGKDFISTSRRYVSFVGISPVQMISIATSLIPFLEHDDANRALMGSNMQRQAVPLIRPQRPLVGTGLEARAVSDSGHALTTSTSGFVLYVSGSKILLYNNSL